VSTIATFPTEPWNGMEPTFNVPFRASLLALHGLQAAREAILTARNYTRSPPIL